LHLWQRRRQAFGWGRRKQCKRKLVAANVVGE